MDYWQIGLSLVKQTVSLLNLRRYGGELYSWKNEAGSAITVKPKNIHVQLTTTAQRIIYLGRVEKSTFTFSLFFVR